jgi:hypothetical protein
MRAMRLFARVGGLLLGSTLLTGCFSPLTTLPEPPDAWGPAGAGDLAACDSALQLGSYCAPESRSAVVLPEPEATPVAERPVPGGDEVAAAPPVEVPAWFPIDVPAVTPTAAPIALPATIPTSAPVNIPADPPLRVPIVVPAEPPAAVPTPTPTATHTPVHGDDDDAKGDRPKKDKNKTKHKGRKGD